MKKLLLVLILLTISTGLFADLEDFRKKVETTEKEQPNAEEPAEAKKDNNTVDPFLALWVQLFRIIWVMNNTTTTYGSYPFSPDGYICLAKIEDASVDHLVYATTGKRDQWFKTEIQGIWMQDIGFGSWITFKGQLYRFIGVHCEDWMIIDGHNVLNGLRLGLSLSLVQSDPFSLSAYGQWNLWSGVLERNGGTLGLDIDSFPVKPVALHFKAGFQLFRNYSMGELEAQIGILFGSLECFVGWRYWNLINDGGSTAYKFNGAFGGLRLYY